MDEGINNILLDELFEAHGIFENIIEEMKENNINYPYEDVINMEDNSYHISYNAISRMSENIEKYNYYYHENEDFFKGEKKIFFKYLTLYIFSIIIIKVFAKTLSSDKLNEIWYTLFGLALGTANASIISNNINNYRYGKKENRDLYDKIYSCKEEYDQNFEIANREIEYIFALNRNLQQELPHDKVFIKK